MSSASNADASPPANARTRSPSLAQSAVLVCRITLPRCDRGLRPCARRLHHRDASRAKVAGSSSETPNRRCDEPQHLPGRGCRQPPQRVAGHAEGGGPVERLGAEALVEVDGRCVRVVRNPFEAAAVALPSNRAHPTEERFPNPPRRYVGRTNRSSRYSPGFPRNVENVWKYTAKPTATPSTAAMSASAYGRVPNIDRRRSSSVALIVCASCENSASSATNDSSSPTSSTPAGRISTQYAPEPPSAVVVARPQYRTPPNAPGRRRPCPVGMNGWDVRWYCAG